MVAVENQLELFVPGRVCLFGEHSDWAGTYRITHPEIAVGEAIICGTNCGIYARVSRHPDQLILKSTLGDNGISAEIPADTSSLLSIAQSPSPWAYIAGVAYQMRSKFEVGGLCIDNYYTDLPVKKGLSSSAAICVLVARAYNQLYGLGLTTLEEMEYAYLGERTTFSQCGRLDQGCAFGRIPIKMSFDGDSIEITPLQVGGTFHLVLVDLCAGKNTKQILADLNQCYPNADNQIAHEVRALFGEKNQAVVAQALGLMQAGDAVGFGRLMTSAQADFNQYAVPASQAELAAPVLNRLLNQADVQALTWGGKGVGSQGDGSAQFVAKDAAAQAALIELVEKKYAMQALCLTIEPTGSEVGISAENREISS